MNGYMAIYSTKRSSKRKLVKRERELIKYWMIEQSIRLNVCVHKRRIQGIPGTSTLEGCHAGKAAERGIHLSVHLSYQVPPNIPTKYVLYSKCSGDECPSQAVFITVKALLYEFLPMNIRGLPFVLYEVWFSADFQYLNNLAYYLFVTTLHQIYPLWAKRVGR